MCDFCVCKVWLLAKGRLTHSRGEEGMRAGGQEYCSHLLPSHHRFQFCPSLHFSLPFALSHALPLLYTQHSLHSLGQGFYILHCSLEQGVAPPCLLQPCLLPAQHWAVGGWRGPQDSEQPPATAGSQPPTANTHRQQFTARDGSEIAASHCIMPWLNDLHKFCCPTRTRTDSIVLENW